MVSSFLYFVTLTSSPSWIFFIAAITMLSKAYLLLRVFSYYKKSTVQKALWRLIGLIIFCAIFDDFALVFKWIRKFLIPTLASSTPLLTPYLPNIDITTVVWFLRIAWIFCSIQYFCLSLLIEKLVTNNFKWKIRHFVSGLICSTVCLYLLFVSFYDFAKTAVEDRSPYEFLTYKFIYFYLFLTLIPACVSAIVALHRSKLPKILRYQSKLLLLGLIVPFILFFSLSANPFAFSVIGYLHNYGFVGLNNIVMTAMIYFCAHKMIGLRFLNIHSHVQESKTYNFLTDFKVVLEQLGHITSLEDVQNITQNFFHKAFHLPVDCTTLHIRTLPSSFAEHTTQPEAISPIERMLNTANHESHQLSESIFKASILIKDEVEFNAFYATDNDSKKLLEFMESIEADVFLPLYEKQTLTAYIVIARGARPQKLFSNVERDEMLVFASHLSNIIYLLQNRNLENLIKQEKELKEELYVKHQEIQHYKESLRALLKTHTTQRIGILSFRNRVLLCENSISRQLLGIDNEQDVIPYADEMKVMAQTIKKYGIDQKITIKDSVGNPLVCTGSMSIENGTVILLLFYPSLADTFTVPFESLKDLSAWDYAIYLETTRSGQLINELIPGSSESILNFKIELLRVALSKKATLLELPEHDIPAIVNVIHHISLRSILHTITLKKPEFNNEIGIQLFGTAPLFDVPAREGLFEKLSSIGTIFIENVEFLSLETQKNLALYLSSGMFKMFRSDRSIQSNVRLIFSTNADLEILVQQGAFSSELLHELRKASLSMPSLLRMPAHELIQLAQALSEQALKYKPLNHVIALNEKEAYKIIDSKPISIQELKEKVHSSLIHKINKNYLHNEVTLEPAQVVNDPEILDAVKLGKYALKDKSIMTKLWNKFQNQTKIATLLNVNRSSVNRRCKEFNLISDEHRE